MRIHRIGPRAFVPPLPPLPPRNWAIAPAQVAPVAPVTDVAAIAAAKAARIERQRRIGEREKQKPRDESSSTIQTVSLSDPALLPIVVKQFPVVHALDLHRCAELLPKHFVHIAHLPDLVTLNLSTCRGVTRENLTALASLPALREIDIRACLDCLAEDIHALQLIFSHCALRHSFDISQFSENPTPE